MHLFNRVISMLLILAACINISAQKAPEWIKETGFKSLTYSYLIVRNADSNSPEKAEQLALNKVNESVNGNSYTVIDTYKTRISEGTWRTYVLVQVSRMTGYNVAERLEQTNTYKLYGESFIPGMAQIKKGQTGKGVAFIAAEALCVGGIIVGEAQRSSWNSKIKTTQNAQQKLSYKDKADNWATMRNIAIGGAVAVYAWNVIDGIVAKGKTQIVGPDGKRYAFSPYYAPETFASPESVGLAMNITQLSVFSS